MSSDVQAKWMNSATRAISGTVDGAWIALGCGLMFAAYYVVGGQITLNGSPRSALAPFLDHTLDGAQYFLLGHVADFDPGIEHTLDFLLGQLHDPRQPEHEDEAHGTSIGCLAR